MDHANRSNGKTVSVDATRATLTTTKSASCGIAFMAKASAPGRTKTRLVPPLTFEEAASLNTAFLQDVANNVLLAAKGAASDAGIAGYAAFGPPGSEAFFHQTLPPAIGLIEAWLPNFGDCLLRTIEEIFARGHRSAVVLNSDSPTLPTAFLIETAEMLARPGDRVVLGPSSDGGYYLLGLKTAHQRLFEDIAWSTERVAEQTLERAAEIGLEVYRLPVWYDIDDVESLRRLQSELRRPEPLRHRLDGQKLHHAEQTAALLSAFRRERDLSRRIGSPMSADNCVLEANNFLKARS
jgi:rSAM/selenodomain-associated transferase 1